MSAEITKAQRFDPDQWTIPGNDGERNSDRKFPPASTLYPELNDFARGDVARYMTREQMELERNALWARAWTLAGRASDLPVAGSYLRYDLGAESIVVVRGENDVIRAFYNVCQHRGRQLVDDEFGTRPRFVCPFHSWSYDLSGRNIRVTDRELFSAHALCGDIDLKPLRCETWAGFVFVNMNPHAAPLLDYLSDVPALMTAYRMEDMHVVKDTVLPLPCNWKAAIESFLETYHLHMTHPQVVQVAEDSQNQLDVFRNGHCRLVTPTGIPSLRLDDRESVRPLMQYLLHDAGIDPAAFSGAAREVRAAVQAAKRDPHNKYGLDYSAFTDSQLTDVWNYFIFPNMTLNPHPEGVLVMRFLPHETDPEQSYYHVQVIMRKLKPGCRAPFYMGVSEEDDISGNMRPPRRYTTLESPDLGEVLEQDISNMRAVQLGMKSRGFPGGVRFAEHEQRIQVMHAEAERYYTGSK
jgi:phenylpropionate dioxygenase-like ring-hydroxylating dioxygenase large terminal subunit